MLYDIGQADSSGRIASNDIIDALHWRPGCRLEVTVTQRTIVIRIASDGPFTVPRRPCILIPSHARRFHGIKPGDHVLVAAAPDYGLVIVYPLTAFDEMIARYHADQREAETPR
jgi:bifunctional DNA-binding transcriptional regulator/antitoxin component of YhaV-PrlF toxin-antitoxin module